ncbi:hypothetical protein [Comamonas kerstersii]|uniref:Zinc ribbon domain-containing protein n=1 Tax=Comamonas kerstersii TaxID=225992 RepID=A0A6A1R1I0_9BURK|nr:hypothetical protein [Comamonas kerstersii]KAB0586186.1 hypothetical protein F7P80_11165 [Comamonas kerstersii]
MEIFLLWLLLSVAVGVWASKRGRSFWGWMLFSLLLSPLVGFVFVAIAGKAGDAAWPRDELGQPITPETHVHCPDCRELVRKDARKCKHCQTALIPQT